MSRTLTPAGNSTLYQMKRTRTTNCSLNQNGALGVDSNRFLVTKFVNTNCLLSLHKCVFLLKFLSCFKLAVKPKSWVGGFFRPLAWTWQASTRDDSWTYKSTHHGTPNATRLKLIAIRLYICEFTAFREEKTSQVRTQDLILRTWVDLRIRCNTCVPDSVDCVDTQGAFFWAYSGIGIVGISQTIVRSRVLTCL